LHADVAAWRRPEAALLEEVAHELESAAVIHPRVLLAVVETESDAGIEGIGRVLANIERGERVAAIDGAVLRRVQDLQRRHDLATGKRLNLEFLIGQLGDALAHGFDRAEHRVEAFRPARRQPPSDRRAGLRDRRGGERSRGHASARTLEKCTPFHFALLPETARPA
jgi:hypothetical protein